MSEKIIIPLDDYRSNETTIYQVMKVLCEIKPEETTDIVLLAAIKPPVKHIPVEGGVVDIYGDEEELQEKKNAAGECLKEAVGKLKIMGVAVSCRIFVGQPGDSTADIIVRAEKELGGDMVAMSVPDKRGFRHRSLQKTAEKVMDIGDIPVIMVPVHT